MNEKPLIDEYLLRKHLLFEKDAFFIHSFETHWDVNGNMGISVAAIKIEDDIII